MEVWIRSINGVGGRDPAWATIGLTGPGTSASRL